MAWASGPRRLLSLGPGAGKLPYVTRLTNRKVAGFSSAKDIEAFVASTPAGEFHASTVAKSFLSMAEHKSTHKPSAEKLAVEAKRVAFADEGELAQTCLAIAQLGLLDRIPVEMVSQLKEKPLSTPSSISNTLCVLALDQEHAGAEHSSLASRLLDQMEAMPHWDLFRTKHLVQVTWAVATLQPSNRSALVSRLVSEFCRHRDLSLVKTGELSNLAWAVSTLRVCSPALFALVGQEIAHRHGQGDLVGYKARCVVGLAWAFARQPMAAPAGVMEKLCREAAHHCKSFTPSQAATMLCALSEKSFTSDKTLIVLTQQVLDNLDSATALDLAQTLHAFAWFGASKKSGVLLPKLVSEVCSRPLDRRTACTTLWSLAALDLLGEDHVREYFNRPALDAPLNCTFEQAHQVFQTTLMWQQAFPKQPLPALLADGGLASTDQIQSCVEKMDQGFTDFQVQALECVLEHFPDAVNNKVLLGGITCDIFVESQNTALFIDYPSRFCVNDAKLATGVLRTKQRILERAGYKVLHLAAGAKFKRSANSDKHRLIKQLIKQFN